MSGPRSATATPASFRRPRRVVAPRCSTSACRRSTRSLWPGSAHDSHPRRRIEHAADAPGLRLDVLAPLSLGTPGGPRLLAGRRDPVGGAAVTRFARRGSSGLRFADRTEYLFRVFSAGTVLPCRGEYAHRRPALLLSRGPVRPAG